MTQDENPMETSLWNNPEEVFEWVDIETTAAERLISLSCSVGRARSLSRSQTWKLVLAGCLASLFLYAVWRLANVSDSGGELLLADLSLMAAILFSYDHHIQRCLAVAVASRWRCALREDGLLIDASSHHALWRWQAVTALERRSDALLVYLAEGQVLLLPYRCFASWEMRMHWLARLEVLSGKKALEKAELPSGCSVSSRCLHGFFRNLYGGLQLLMFRKAGVGALCADASPLVLLVLCWLGARLAADFSALSLEQGLSEALAGSFYGHGILDGLAVVFLVLLCAWLAVRTIATSRVLEAFLVLALPLWWAAVLQEGFFWWDASWWRSVLVGGLWCWALLAGGVGLVRALELRLPQKILASFCILMLCVLIHVLQANDFTLWIPADNAEPAGQAAVAESMTHESVLYAQPGLLAEALDAVRPGKKGVPELYLLAFGGYGGQDVFLHEVESVERLFAEKFGAQDHSVVLVNSPQTLDRRPMATTIALREALDAIGRKMNREEDVLFLFMTSHGAQDHRFALDLGPYVFDELTPSVLRQMLDEAGIKNRVILVSACYSGGFIHDLESANTLVMTASREDRSSHGCQQGADWTFFGKAYFDEALRHTNSFEKAFGEASVIVANREREEGVVPSEPQVYVGSGIRPVLAAWEKTQRQNGAK